LVVILLMFIGDYSVVSYWCLFYWWLLMPILRKFYFHTFFG